MSLSHHLVIISCVGRGFGRSLTAAFAHALLSKVRAVRCGSVITLLSSILLVLSCVVLFCNLATTVERIETMSMRHLIFTALWYVIGFRFRHIFRPLHLNGLVCL